MESTFSQLAWLIPLLPLLAFLILMAAGRMLKENGAYIGIIATFVAFVLSILVWSERLGGSVQDYTQDGWQWIHLGDFIVRIGYEITNLNALMLVIVSFVSFVVNIYSKGYMQGDNRIHVFFSYVALFTFSMLGLVISANLIELYIFWELVGVCSFLLIGFWYFKPEAKAAAKKAFIVTRIGDVGLLVAILLLYWNIPDHLLEFSAIHNAISQNLISGNIVTWIAILIFVGAVGKSGQFPLHIWLPDAMEGPTPISALIHAATMVAAGVYLVARTYDVFLASPTALTVVAIVGGFTAIFAATIGVAQNDIKRVLAYSTVSQLGYMMMALGLGTWLAYTAGIFHLFTHAFFKALLFLGAGSVIHAAHTQDINEMGGLGKKMKITAWTFGIGALALSGIAPLSGFWSKDLILAEAYDNNRWLFWIGLIAAFFTAFYMSRLFFLVFAGKPKKTEHAHESPASMTFPLVILAVLAVAAGFVLIPGNPWLAVWLTGQEDMAETVNWTVFILSNAVGLLGILLGWLMYAKQTIARDAISARVPWLYTLVHRKYFIDEIYQAVIVRPLRFIALLLQWFDNLIVDGIVRLVALIAVVLGRLDARMQNGQLQSYGLITVVGFMILLIVLVGRRFIHVG
ncbi:MAG TPA: NADH-quinone oxidoreductase subunit L [Bacilli bacterium]